MLSRLRFIDEPDQTERTAARDLLCERLASTPRTADNQKIIAKVLGMMKGELHCHHTKRPLADRERRRYRCTICKCAGSGIVAAACFRHVEQPRRATSGQVPFTELLLLAVGQAHERQGFGRALVEHINQRALIAGSHKLVVVSNGHAFWRHPRFSFADLEDAGRLAVFVPWSHGIQLLARTAALPIGAEAEWEAHLIGHSVQQAMHGEPSSSTALVCVSRNDCGDEVMLADEMQEQKEESLISDEELVEADETVRAEATADEAMVEMGDCFVDEALDALAQEGPGTMVVYSGSKRYSSSETRGAPSTPPRRKQQRRTALPEQVSIQVPTPRRLAPDEATSGNVTLADLQTPLGPGCRVDVFFAAETVWFRGTVTVLSRSRGLYVKYDPVEGEDDFEEWVDLVGGRAWKQVSVEQATKDLPSTPHTSGCPPARAASKSTPKTARQEDADKVSTPAAKRAVVRLTSDETAHLPKKTKQSQARAPSTPRAKCIAAKKVASKPAPRKYAIVPYMSCDACGCALRGPRTKTHASLVICEASRIEVLLCAACEPHVRERIERVRREHEYCAVCEVSWRDVLSGDDVGENMIQCVRCQMWVHSACERLGKELPAGWDTLDYECPTCRGAPPGERLTLPSRSKLGLTRCMSCEKTERELGARCVRVDVASHGEQPLCERCARRWADDEYCPVCERLYEEVAEDAAEMPEEMLACDSCNKWVHVRCEGLPHDVTLSAGTLPYHCPDCRSQEAGEGRVVEALRLQHYRATDTCLVCKRRWQGEHEEMVCCESCDLWVHTTCERLPPGSAAYFDDPQEYHCPRCRGDDPSMGVLVAEARAHTCTKKNYCVICIRPWKERGRKLAQVKSRPGNEETQATQEGHEPRQPRPDDMVCCDSCNLWVHVLCDMELPEESIEKILDDKDATYSCPSCRCKPIQCDLRSFFPPRPASATSTGVANNTVLSQRPLNPDASGQEGKHTTTTSSADIQHAPRLPIKVGHSYDFFHRIDAKPRRTPSSPAPLSSVILPSPGPSAGLDAELGADGWVGLETEAEAARRGTSKSPDTLAPDDAVVATDGHPLSADCNMHASSAGQNSVYSLTDLTSSSRSVTPSPFMPSATRPMTPSPFIPAPMPTMTSSSCMTSTTPPFCVETVYPMRSPCIPLASHVMPYPPSMIPSSSVLTPPAGLSLAAPPTYTPTHTIPSVQAAIMHTPPVSPLLLYGQPCQGFVFDPAMSMYVPLADEVITDVNPTGHESASVPMDGSAETATAAIEASRQTRAHYEACAAKFESLSATNVEAKMRGFCEVLEAVYGDLPFTRLDWGTSILGTLVGLVCAQTCRNSWSSIGYANLAATFPTDTGEPDWDLIRQREPADIEPCIWHGPYFHRKAERIHELLRRAHDDSGGVATSMERLHSWPSERVRSYLMGISGISGKSAACLLLYRMGRVDFAVDANVLRVMTRLGWLKAIGIYATEGLSVVDRRAAQRAGAILPTTMRSRHPMALPPPQPTVTQPTDCRKRKAATVLSSNRAERRDLVHVRVLLLVSADGSVSAGLACNTIKPMAPAVAHGQSPQVFAPSFTLSSAEQPRSAGSKRRRCGSCPGCRTANCGECGCCKDMPKFGGPGRQRQSCMRRVCTALSKQQQAAPISVPPPALTLSMDAPMVEAETSDTAQDAHTTDMSDAAAAAAAVDADAATTVREGKLEPLPVNGWKLVESTQPMECEPAAEEVLMVAPTTVVSELDVMRLTAEAEQAQREADELERQAAEALREAEEFERLAVEAQQEADECDRRLAHASIVQAPAFASGALEAMQVRLQEQMLGADDATDPEPMVADNVICSPSGDEHEVQVASQLIRRAIEKALAQVQEHATNLNECIDNAIDSTEITVGLNSERYQSADGSTALRVVGTARLYCKKHKVYHVCDWTRRHVLRAQRGATGIGSNIGAGSDTSQQAARGSTDDIEDVPKPLKRFSKRTQAFMQEILPTETPAYSPLHQLLYRAHVFMITHGAVLCGETPQCSDCPLRSKCEYGSLLRTDDKSKAGFQAATSSATLTPASVQLASSTSVARPGAAEIAPQNVIWASSVVKATTSSIETVTVTQALDVPEIHSSVESHGEAPHTLPVLCSSSENVEMASNGANRSVLQQVDREQSAIAATMGVQMDVEDVDDVMTAPVPAPALVPAPVPLSVPAPAPPVTLPVLAPAPVLGPVLEPVILGPGSVPVATAHLQMALDCDVQPTSERLCSPAALNMPEQEYAAAVLAEQVAPDREVEMVVDTSVNPNAQSIDPIDESPFDAAGAEVAARIVAAALALFAPGCSSSSTPLAAHTGSEMAPTPLPYPLSALAAASCTPDRLPGANISPEGKPLADQMAYAREVHDPTVAPQHPGDATPRLLLLHGTLGDYARGRLLLSPWSAFRGVFPMHGTYFAQNEVFEDESAGEVRLPLATLGRERRVFLGKSVEGVLRRRSAAELAQLFRDSFVCIRRFRSTDGRLLPLVLDPPRLLKHKASPSELALSLGLSRPLLPSNTVPADGPLQDAVAETSEMLATSESPNIPSQPSLPSCSGCMEVDSLRTDVPTNGTTVVQSVPVSDASEDRIYIAAFERATRLFALYMAAGGAICMRPAVWRRIMNVLHPDKGGHVRVFQHITALKRQVDAGEYVKLPEPHGAEYENLHSDISADELYCRLREELKEAAVRAGGHALRMIAQFGL